MNGLLLCSSDFLIFMNYSLDKNHFGKKILYLRDHCPSNFNTLGCGHSLFPLRDSRGKQTRKPASAKSPMVLKRDARVEPARKSPNAASNFYVHSRVVLAGLIVLSGKSRPSSLSFLLVIVERNE